MYIPIDKNADRGCYGRREVVTKAVKPNALVPATGGQHVYRHRTIRHRGSTKGTTMEGAKHGKEHKAASNEIATENDEIDEETYKQHLLARKAVNDEAAERAHQQRHKGITAKHHADGVFGGMEGLAEIKWQQWRQKIEREEQGKVCHHYPIVVCVP